MANICDNDFYVESKNKKNLKYIYKFIDTEFPYSDINEDYLDGVLNIKFESKWVFPIEIMEELYKGLPDKKTYLYEMFKC